MLTDPILSDLRTMTLAGGEPFQREDLLELCDLIHHTCKNLIQLYLSSNGFDHDGIERKVISILRIMPNLKRLRIAVSFDHVREEHDRIRGRKGIHGNALSLVERLKAIGDPRLTVQGNFTIAPHNVRYLHEIHDYFKSLSLKVFWFPIMVSDNFFENEDKSSALSFSREENELLKSFTAFLRRQENSIPDYYYYSGLRDTLNRGERTFPCSGGSKFLMVNSTGEVYPCYIIPKSYRMGSIREHSLSDIWKSEDANQIRGQILKNPTCKRCIQWYDGYALSNSMKVFSGLVLKHPLRIVRHFAKY
jgi:MoaA/NifB/PqqE/SkfB family radical SAM enzyme